MAHGAQIHGRTRTAAEPSAEVSFSTDELDAREARDRWSDTLVDLYCEMAITWPAHDERFGGHWAGHQFGDLHISAIRAGQHTVVRSTEMARSDGNRDLLLCLVADGYVEVTQEGRKAVLDGNSFAVLDCSKPFRYHCPKGFWQIVVRTPRELLTARLPESVVSSVAAKAIPGACGAGKLVADVLNGMAAAGDSVSSGAAIALSGSALDMLATAVTEACTPANATAEAHSRDLVRAQQMLKRNLHDADYALGDLAADLGVSVRYIQTLFADAGTTPRTWLQQMRIDRARNQLLTTGLTVAEVAVRAGFRDVSHFSRTFRARMGMSPGHYRADKCSSTRSSITT